MAAISKRLRYEVLRRDSFACYYCGATPPDVKLVVDAVVPEALGGSHKDPANLVTACEPCNSGKTSSSPDAPLVAAVADDAAEWAEAKAAAAEEMRSSVQAREATAEQFDSWWDRELPGCWRPDDWDRSVAYFLDAGLPVDVLRDCLRIAARSQAARGQKWRYMCAVAWNRIKEIQERASGLSEPPGEPAEVGEDVEDAAIQNWCRLILAQREPRDVEAASRECLEYAGDDESNGVLWFVIRDLEMERASLREYLRDLMNALPGDLGARLIREHEEWQREHRGDRADPNTALVTASQWAAEHLMLNRARQEMAMMPRSEYEAWIQRSMDENADIAEHLDRPYYVLDGARMAREALAAAGARGEG